MQPHRRTLLAGGAGLLLPRAAFAADPVVETRYGRVRGAMEGGLAVFKGVRYAASTEGQGRFRPPRPPEPWAGVVDALAFGASAPQANPNPPRPPPRNRIIMGQLPRPAGAPPPAPARESEDCLFLNLWTPAVNDGRKRPVMVWLHGGFFSGGSGSTDDPAGLARRGEVVAVSVNHRLNVLGYSHLGDIGGPDWAHSGNLGMLDIIAALEWVRDNIDRFGGDPRRVMVFGESGGGMKTSFLMASPPARGLFSRAGVQSGPGLRMMERPAATRISELLLAELGLKPSELDRLRTLPLAQIMAARYAVEAKLPVAGFTELLSFAPVIDPRYLPRHPFSPAAPAGAADIPLLIGWNRDEMSFFMGDDPEGFTLDQAGLERRLRSFLDGQADPALAAYRRADPTATPSQIYIRAWSDYSIMHAAVRQAERKAAQRAGVYVYRFDWRSPALGGKLGALHTIEAPFVFDTVERSPLASTDPGARALAAKMSGAWTAFAATGRPAAQGLPAWPAYERGRRRTMVLGESCQVVDDPGRAERLILDKVADRGV